MTTEQCLKQVMREWLEIYVQRSFRDFKRFMDENDLSPSQVGALMRLHHCGNTGISEIAEAQGITVPAASQLVDRLVQQGLLARTEAPHDRRFKQITLTARGQELVEDGIRSRQAWMESLTSAFTPDEQECIVNALTLLTRAARQVELPSR